ncbi:forkhead box protein N4 isoform X3 [Paroedura picta]|uniref:forkhead box protein N4 isoform X3 n=1 Tax=Paroedura picta TaxID=143630 RepID=UPI004056D416
MIDSELPSATAGLLRSSGHGRRPPPQEFRLLASGPPQLSEEDVPSDLQSLSWLTSVDVPRLQQRASERMDYGTAAQSALLLQEAAGSVPANMVPSGPPSALLHLQASLPQGMLGLNTVSSHGANMGPYAAAAGQPSPSLRPPHPPLFTPPSSCSAPQVFAIAHNPAQCSAAPLFSTSYGAQPLYSQPRIAPHAAHELHAKHYPKPIYSYSCLIAMALKNSKAGSLPVSEIYSFMKEHFPYFKTAPDGWKNSVRHNLSLNKCFEKVENTLSSTSRKGCLWALNPAKIDKMEEEMQKWKRKDLAAIHRSMANPEELDKLITDRPESCRRLSKAAEAEVSALSHAAAAHGRMGQLQPQPVMTLSLQAVPLHHQIQTQACLTPDSPAPAQTPPLHALHSISQSPLPQHLVSRAPDFLSVATDMSTEVDALDPSIMDFALQGNFWDEMKDDSFSLETWGAFSNSPLALADCDMIPSGLNPVSGGGSNDRSFADLQVTGLYTTYTALDTVSSPQYISSQGNKPIALL